MANPEKYFQNPREEKNKHLFIIWPMILYCRGLTDGYINSIGNLGGDKDYNLQRKVKDTWKEFDFKELDDYVKKNIDGICNELNLKWLSSLCECYADLGESEHDRFCGVLLSTFYRLTQTSTSYLYKAGIFDDNYNWPEELNDKKFKKSAYKIDIFDGTHLRTGDDKIIKRLIVRAKNVIDDKSVFYKLLHTIIGRIIEYDTAFYFKGVGSTGIYEELKELLDEF